MQGTIYQVRIQLTAERLEGPETVWEGSDWQEAKDKLNFWANEYKREMDSITLRIRGTP